jgi:hypothetical protein
MWGPSRIGVFRALWLGVLVSNIGLWMQTVGAQWLLLQQANAAVLVALSVQDDLAAPGEALQGVAPARPWHGENHDPRARGVLHGSRRRPVRK